MRTKSKKTPKSSTRRQATTKLSKVSVTRSASDGKCAPVWLAKCKQRGLTTSLDANWDPDNRWEAVLDLLPHVDVFFCQTLPGGHEARGNRNTSVSRQPNLGASIDRNYRTAEPNRDGVGAGDNFDARLLRSWLFGGDVEACLLWGHRCAVSSLEHQGGTRGQLRECMVRPRTNNRPRSDRTEDR